MSDTPTTPDSPSEPPMRAVFETLGVHDIVTKSIGSSNPQNMVRATFEALQKLKSPRQIAAKRGKKVSEIFGRREKPPAKE